MTPWGNDERKSYQKRRIIKIMRIRDIDKRDNVVIELLAHILIVDPLCSGVLHYPDSVRSIQANLAHDLDFRHFDLHIEGQALAGFPDWHDRSLRWGVKSVL